MKMMWQEQVCEWLGWRPRQRPVYPRPCNHCQKNFNCIRRAMESHSAVIDDLIVPKFYSFENYWVLEIQWHSAHHARFFSIRDWNSHHFVNYQIYWEFSTRHNLCNRAEVLTMPLKFQWSCDIHTMRLRMFLKKVNPCICIYPLNNNFAFSN